MKRLDDWFRDYGQSHQHPVNVAIHKVAVPGIYLCILALLWCLPAVPCQRPSTGRELVAIPVLVFYPVAVVDDLYGDDGPDRPGTGLLPRLAGPLLWPALIGFVLFWIAHRRSPYRGETPSFLTDLQFLLVGPAWVLASLYRRLGIPSEGGQQERP